MSNFDFLTSEWKDIYEAASKAESAAIPGPRVLLSLCRENLKISKNSGKLGTISIC